LSKPYSFFNSSSRCLSRSRPALYRLVSPGPALASASTCSTGPPGTNCMTMKVMVSAPTSVGTISSTRLTM